MPAYPGSWGNDEKELWAEISDDRQGEFRTYLENDRTAMALFDAGWLKHDDETDEEINTKLMRDAFFDYAIEEGFLDDRGEFDWEAWRQYMGYEEG